MTLNALIIDDELVCRTILRQKLKKCDSSINVVAETATLKETIAYFKKKLTKIDVLFLDIEMPDGTGFQLLEQLSPINFEIVFTTSHQELAIESFNYDVLDFLTKPIKKTALERAIQKVKRRFFKNHTSTRQSIPKARDFQKVSFPTSTGFEFVPFKDIVRCEASGAYTIVYIKGQEKNIITVSKNLAEVEKKLPEEKFLRISRSHLINLSYLKKYERSGHIILEDGTIIEVPRRKRDDFLNFF